MIFFDTETCGFHGPMVLLQYAEDHNEIKLVDIWKTKRTEILELIEYLITQDLVAFNLAFDWFKIIQTYTTLRLCDTEYPEVFEYWNAENKAIFGPCLKPYSVLDLMLHARKGPYQSTMNRKEIRVRKIPKRISYYVRKKLDEDIPLKDIYFARKSDPTIHWTISDRKNKKNEIDPDFVDVVLKFAPSSALKALAADALNHKTTYIDEVTENLTQPLEVGWAPYGKRAFDILAHIPHALGKQVQSTIARREHLKFKGTWPDVIHEHIDCWANNKEARQYAYDDVKYTRELYHYFNDLYYKEHNTNIPFNDRDSQLAAMVAAVRWKGFNINLEGIAALRDKAARIVKRAKCNINSSKDCIDFLKLDETNISVLKTEDGYSTKASILETISKWKESEVCPHCNGSGILDSTGNINSVKNINKNSVNNKQSCTHCQDGLISGDKPHPSAKRARHILRARRAKKEIELFDKLLYAKRLHANFNVIGTKSSRMSGAGGLNPQGIKRTKVVRRQFPLADPEYMLIGGDFAGFEVCLMDAAYKDPELRKDLTTKRECMDCKGSGQDKNGSVCKECKGEGKANSKIHALFGQQLYKCSYEEIINSKGLPGDQDKYSRSKNCVFTAGYGGDENTMHKRYGIPFEQAKEGMERWIARYKVWGANRQKIMDMFCTMKQEKLGGRVTWQEPADYIESMFGFKRYFNLETSICKALFNLANKPPKEWKEIDGKVMRREERGEQTLAGASQSALFAAAFAIQSACMRAAANHVIQSSGADATKELQVRLWELQPKGINDWHVQPMNIHDEIMVPAKPELESKLEKIVKEFVIEYKQYVPLMEIDWGRCTTWADK